jgi:hypothetical protein
MARRSQLPKQESVDIRPRRVVALLSSFCHLQRGGHKLTKQGVRGSA